VKRFAVLAILAGCPDAPPRVTGRVELAGELVFVPTACVDGARVFGAPGTIALTAGDHHVLLVRPGPQAAIWYDQLVIDPYSHHCSPFEVDATHVRFDCPQDLLRADVQFTECR